MPRERRHPKVKYKKLGRERAWGQYDGRVIEIDPRTKGKRRLDTLIHEYLHHRSPHYTEDHVKAEATAIADFLWTQGYRQYTRAAQSRQKPCKAR